MSSRFSYSYFSSSHLYCLLLFSALFHFCLCNHNIHDALCIESEKQALLEFKHGLIDEAGRLASWVGEENDCCKWVGIGCDNITGHVDCIHLPGLDAYCSPSSYYSDEESEEASNQRLKGNLSPSLLHLTQLTHLDLSCNDFGRIQIPKFIGSLGNLRYLNLSNSFFGGIIPPQLGNLSELRVLSLGTTTFHQTYRFEFTSMSKMQWLSSLRLMHHLELSGVDLSKATDWLQVISSSFPYLLRIHLSNCQLADIHPRVPSLNTTSLLLLDLSDNNFNTSFPRWVFGLTSLVSLDLSRCFFQGFGKNSFGNLTSLEHLYVSGNDFMNSSLVLEGLSSVGSNLVSLDISNCGVSSSVLKSLHNLTSVLSLDLSGNHLTEIMPKPLGNFCNVRYIDLSCNDYRNLSLTRLLESFFECKSPSLKSLYLYFSSLSGDLPDQLGQLMHLVHLVLGNNHISGTIPTSIGRLSFLRTLDLRMNLISGPVSYSIGRLSSLEELHLSNNRLNGSLPDSLGQLSKLKILDFSFNLLNGVMTEDHFAKLASLRYVGGTGNNVVLKPRNENWIPSFQLRKLYLRSCCLGPQFPLWLQFQRDLKELDISNTNISSPVPESFWRSFPNLAYLDMSQNHIQGTLRFFVIPATLRVLDLSSNEFSGKLPDLPNGSFPNHLDLSNNLFSGSLHHLMCSDGVKETLLVNLGNNSLSGVIPECWEKWPRLYILNLENNNLSGGIPRSLGFSSELVALNMHGNKLSGRLPASLMNLRRLEILQLGRNELVGSIPSWFGTELASLRILNLRSNNFRGDIPRELCYLTAIQILDLADNNLSGNIPRCFNNFSVLSGRETKPSGRFMYYAGDITKKVVTHDSLVMKGREDTYSTILPLVMLLDLSDNNISGSVPGEITALHELTSLNLSRNQLTGYIPEKIGDMKSLISFDFSLNMLSGELPTSLSNLNFLSSFNVSYNSLTGRVPSSTQFQTFNESSFSGNKLCGAPLPESCVSVEVPIDQQEDNVLHGSVDWGFIVSVACGFIFGFWIFVAPLIFSEPWRIAYFRFLSEKICFLAR